MDKQSFKLKWDSVFLHKEKLVEKPLLKMLYMAVVLTLLAFLYISGVGCVWRFLFHYPCPGCGITRACVALVHGDFKAAFEYNYMFISLPIIFAYILFDGRIFKSKKVFASSVPRLVSTLLLLTTLRSTTVTRLTGAMALRFWLHTIQVSSRR